MTAPYSNQAAPASVRTGEVAEASSCQTLTMVASPVRVAILDDHEMVRDGFRVWLEAATSDLQVVIAAPSWADLITHSEFPVDVVLLDLDLGDCVPAAVKIAMLRSSGVAIVVVSTFADPPHIRECITAGALGYVPKSEPAAEIVRAVKTVARGESYVTPTVAEVLLTDQGLKSADGVIRPKLSPKEIEALVLYASDLPMKSVANRMGVEYDTAKGYIDRVREKYATAGREARTKLELRRRAIQDGLIAGE